MNYYEELKKKIKKNKAIVCVIGLGYVGSAIIEKFDSKNFRTIGIDKDKRKFTFLSKKKMKLTTEYKFIDLADIIIIALPTPLKNNMSPDLSYIEGCMQKIKPYLKKGQLISLESTTYPGTTEEIILPILKKKNFTISKDFFLVYSPERISPEIKVKNKKIKYKFHNTPKIYSGYSNQCKSLAALLYKKVTKKVILASSLKMAETTKMIENIFRSINIGLVNEIKIICDKVGINVHKVINLAKTKPYGFTKFDPGPGIGGHCIPIDPFFLSWYAEKNNVSSNFIKHSGIINKIVKDWIFKKILDIEKRPKKKLNIFFLGVTYKKNVNDIRESPAIYLMDKCLKNKINVKFNDPFVQTIEVNKKKINSTSLNSNLNSIDVAILTADHDQYNYEKIYNKFRIIIDTRGRYQNLKNSKIIHA